MGAATSAASAAERDPAPEPAPESPPALSPESPPARAPESPPAPASAPGPASEPALAPEPAPESPPASLATPTDPGLGGGEHAGGAQTVAADAPGTCGPLNCSIAVLVPAGVALVEILDGDNFPDGVDAEVRNTITWISLGAMVRTAVCIMRGEPGKTMCFRFGDAPPSAVEEDLRSLRSATVENVIVYCRIDTPTFTEISFVDSDEQTGSLVEVMRSIGAKS